MKKNIILILILLIIIIIIIVINKKNVSITNPLPKPAINQNINAPKEIKYDSNTDLTKELESINPQVLDNDFVVE